MGPAFMGFPAYRHDEPFIVESGALRPAASLVYRPSEPVVVLGRGSEAAVEIDLEACARDGVAIERRRGGGCSVVVDPGDVLVSVLARDDGVGRITEHFARLTGRLIEGLAAAGVEGVRGEGVSDLAIGDRKIAGSCIWRSRGLVLFTCSILAEPRIDLMHRWLRHPPREPAYRRGRPHSSFVMALSELHGPGIADRLASSLSTLDWS